HVVVQADAHVLRVVEHDVGTLRNEADIEQQVREVRDPNARPWGQSGEARGGRKAVQVGDHVLDDQPAAYAARLRRVEGVEVDCPAARGERLRAAVGERESGA